METNSRSTRDVNVAPVYVSYFKSKKLSSTASLTKGTGSGAKIVKPN